MTRARIYKNITLLQVVIALLSPLFLLPSCSSSDDGINETNPKDEKLEIGFNADVWKLTEATRATTYDSQSALQAETDGFRTFIYNDGSTTLYNSDIGSVVKWDTDKWVFQDGKHYWPAEGRLDFFAYMPATKPSYISSLTYSTTSTPSVTHSVTFSADLSSVALTEFIFALTTGQDKTNAASGVTLNFLHPFARVKFATGTVPSTVTINSVSLSGVMTKGDFSYDGSTPTWSEQSTTGSIGGLDDWIVVVPYNNGSQTLTVNCTWSDWSNVTKDLTASITADWTAGTSYTYTLNISKDYALTVSTEKYTEQW